MERANNLAPSATDLIDWINGEEILELDWDFPENGDLHKAGMDSNVVVELTAAIEMEYGVEMVPQDLKKQKIKTPIQLAQLIASKQA